MGKQTLVPSSPGIAIQAIMLDQGEAYPFEVYRALRLQYPKKKTSYASMRRLFWALERIGLIEFSRVASSERGWDRRYYRVAPGMENDRRWYTYPLIELYPSAQLGASRYKAWKGGARADIEPGRSRKYAH